jgi:hypothetical protein
VALDSDIDPKIVADRLGRSNTTYTFVLDMHRSTEEDGGAGERGRVLLGLVGLYDAKVLVSARLITDYARHAALPKPGSTGLMPEFFG